MIDIDNSLKCILDSLINIMYLDDKQVPRQNNNGVDYSVVGRIKRLEASFQKQLSELESHYLTFKQQEQ